MRINEAFVKLVENNEFDFSCVDGTIKSLCKKLNDVYYSEASETKHLIIAGSAGRKTLIKGSDIDLCFVLPREVYDRFRNRKGNIQSQLLSEIASKIRGRYPNSDISADGQVVDANFRKTLIEIVPSFLEGPYTQRLVYPDSNNDGSWVVTDPIKQQEEIKNFSALYPSYLSFCKIVRCWKITNNVKIGGIVIDSLVYSFFQSKYDDSYKRIPSQFDYLETFKDFLLFLSSDSCPSSIQIPGEIAMKDTKKERFKNKALKSYKKMCEKDLNLLWDNLLDIFGDGFPDNPNENVRNDCETFIQDMFPVKLNKSLTIDCNVINKGFRSFSILDRSKSSFLSFFVPKSMSLLFFIKDCNVQKPYNIYWKVRNVGKCARERNDIRGNIVQGEETHKETSVFHGPHYVECFIVKNGICVAKDRIDVPIE